MTVTSPSAIEAVTYRKAAGNARERFEVLLDGRPMGLVLLMQNKDVWRALDLDGRPLHSGGFNDAGEFDSREAAAEALL